MSSFFFKGKTRCCICGEIFHERSDATKTPHAYSKNDPLLLCQNAFIHRECFFDWPLKAEFVESVFSYYSHQSTDFPILEKFIFGSDVIILQQNQTVSFIDPSSLIMLIFLDNDWNQFKKWLYSPLDILLLENSSIRLKVIYNSILFTWGTASKIWEKSEIGIDRITVWRNAVENSMF
jgi:hypothetical protein